MEIFSGFWSLILSFILIFLVPFYLAETRRIIINDTRMISEGDRFLDRIKYKGYIDREEMNQFLQKIEDGKIKKVSVIHRRRAVKPIFQDGEIKNTKEFFIEISFDEIKEELRENGRYLFFIGDEVEISIENSERGLPFIDIKPIIIGGMVENEFEEN